MYMIAIAAAILCVPFVMAWYYRKATKRLIVADQAWGSLEYHANQLLQDKTLPPIVGDFVEFVVERTGDGTMTRTFLYSLFIRTKADREAPFATAVANLNDGQDKHFNRFVIDALFYDSLRTFLSGWLVRRMIYWLATTAADEHVPVNDAQTMPIAKAASRAYGADLACMA